MATEHQCFFIEDRHGHRIECKNIGPCRQSSYPYTNERVGDKTCFRDIDQIHSLDPGINDTGFSSH